ncbi:MAG TPA: cytochrome P450 [Polyangiales bacterium]|nr:cytochrome P450 [Polyangiales bacterium]
MTLPPEPPLPAAAQTWLWIRKPIPFMRWCRKRYGDTFTVHLNVTGKMVVTCNPEHVKEIFTGDPEEMHAGEVNDILEPIVGPHSVLLLDGARHMRQRRLMLPPFHGERMKLYAQVMQEVTEQRIASWPSDGPFSLRDETQRITLDVILKTVFGLDEAADLDEMRVRLERLTSLASNPFGPLVLLPVFRHDFPFSPWMRFLADRAHADQQIRHEIEARRRLGTQGRSDVLSLLIDATDEQGQHLSNDELRDELVTLLLAGHETTATAIAWAFERSLATPGVYERLQREVHSVLGGERLAAVHLSKLDYLDATIKETLRMRPVVPMVGRRLQVPKTVAGYDLPAGTVLAPNIYLTHHNPDVYDDAETFRPERFMGARTDPYAWFPFGGGIRRCLGMAFALYEMKIVMATILSRARFELAQPVPARIVRRVITLVPEHGTRVRVVPQSAQA